MINPTKLHAELETAGIPIAGVSSDGRIDFLPSATAEQMEMAATILAAHDPVDYVAQDAETSRATILELLDETVELYRSALANWESLSPAQQSALLHRHTQVLERLLVYLRPRLA